MAEIFLTDTQLAAPHDVDRTTVWRRPRSGEAFPQPLDSFTAALQRLGDAIAKATEEVPPWAVAELLAAAAEGLSRGAPLPPLEAVEAEARDWASWAMPREVMAYLVACWDCLPQRERAAFLRRVA
jgi:hypothetical protein